MLHLGGNRESAKGNLPGSLFPRRPRAGQATLEYVAVYAGVLLPLTLALTFTAELLWVWHSVNDFTREGARYAATHCWQGGSNVVAWMRDNVPLTFEREQFRTGEVEITVEYFARDEVSGDIAAFECDGAECSRECVPDLVRISIANYEFRPFLSYLRLPPVRIPNFQTTSPMESAGCSADAQECLP